jgi:cysteine desulfurase
VEAFKQLESARGSVAKALEVHSEEIVFTSGGTESNNLAIKGILETWKEKNLGTPHVITTTIEHPSIKELLKKLEGKNLCRVTYINVDSEGIINLKELKESLTKETVLVSIMYVNNEIGTIQPISEVSKIVRAYRKDNNQVYPYIHTDACQAALFCPLRVPSLGIDLLTLDGSKIYGPRGCGILFVRRGVTLTPELFGGDQEKERRAGTENVASASGFAVALELAQKEKDAESKRISVLRDLALFSIQKAIPQVEVNGSMNNRVPNNINICLKGIDAEFAVLKLDVKGVCISSVTSCRTKKEDSSSYVIEAMGKKDCSKSSLRITLGRFTTKSDIKRATNIIISTLTGMI